MYIYYVYMYIYIYMCATVCPKLNPSPFRQGIPRNRQCGTGLLPVMGYHEINWSLEMGKEVVMSGTPIFRITNILISWIINSLCQY